MSSADNNTEFIREMEVESSNSVLKLYQHSLGDVGCVVWDAGIVLGKYLDHQNSGLCGKYVIDIGSGTGVAGLFAAALGAEVILTDLPEVVPILEKNIRFNQSLLKGSATACVLKWGDSIKHFSVPDVILVSDCIYYDMSINNLIPTLTELCGPNTEILISYEDRILGNKQELLKTFLDALRKSFHIDIIANSEQHPEFQSPDIHLLKCKKKVNS